MTIIKGGVCREFEVSLSATLPSREKFIYSFNPLDYNFKVTPERH